MIEIQHGFGAWCVSQVRNLAPHTRRAYVQQISRFARHFARSPELLGPADIRAYQVHLAQV